MEKFPEGPYSTGYTLMTPNTRKWSDAFIQANNAVEALQIFSNFSGHDEGRSRVRVATLTDPDTAKEIAKRLNDRDELLKALQEVIDCEENNNFYRDCHTNDESLQAVMFRSKIDAAKRTMLKVISPNPIH